MEWVRVGECNHCGQCCNSGNPYTGELGPCPHLLAQDKNRCAIHGVEDSYWGSACKVWPDHPSQIALYDKCSFTFRRVIPIHGG